MEDFIVSISSIMIDDVIYSIDDMRFGNLGGASPHALAGSGVWDHAFGVVSSAGHDFDQLFTDLDLLRIDTAGVQFLQDKTTRAWEVYQHGNQRVMVFQNPEVGIVQAVPDFSILPMKYQKAKGYHILWNGKHEDLFSTLEWLRKNNPHTIIAFEPSRISEAEDENFFQRLFALIDVFSPSISEVHLSGQSAALEEIIKWYLGLGCRKIALRLGPDGSAGAEGPEQIIKVPAVKTEVVDVTGAGNAYVGGLLSGLACNRPLEEAMAMGSVSAGFEVQRFGLCFFNNEMIPQRDAYLNEVLNGITTSKILF
jgi:sugar/nucleoside kinase (ribokinase family)